MKTVFKFTFFILLGISALGFAATGILYIFAPDEVELVEDSKQEASVSDSANEVSAPIEVLEQETAPTDELIEPEVAPEQESIAAEEKEETLPLPETQQISWGFTPAEQGLASGDWISIEGYQDVLIGATVLQYGATRVLKWNDPSELFGTDGKIDITSQSIGVSTPDDRIISVVGLVENPRENETVVRINKALLREKTVLIRVTGQIDRIGGDKSPNRWTVFLKKSVHVDFVEK